MVAAWMKTLYLLVGRWLVGMLVKRETGNGKTENDPAHVCGNSFHALRCPGVFEVEMKIYERSLQALLSLRHPPRLIFTISPKWRAFSQVNRELMSQIE